jgi:myosin-7
MAGDVLNQLQYSGMMEAICIHQEGYALQEEHESFFDHFSVLLSPYDLKGDDAQIVQLVKALSKHLGMSNADWQVGHSKIFLHCCETSLNILQNCMFTVLPEHQQNSVRI